MTNYYLGIDLGTTALKAAVFRAGDGACLARAHRRLPVHTATDGTREQEVAGLSAALRGVCTELRTQVGTAWTQVAGVGLAAQGGSGVLVNRHTGDPHTTLMLWNDARSRPLAGEIADARPADYWHVLSGTAFPGHGLAKLRWYRRQFPHLFTADTLYVGAGEAAYFLLTGAWRQDACNALQIGAYHVYDDRLVEEPLQLAAGVTTDFLAPLRCGHQTHPLSADGERLLGLPVGTPVAGPYMDHEAGYLSALGVSAAPLQCSLGTAWVGNFVVPSPATGASPVQLVIPAPVGAGKLVIQPLLLGNVAWDWALRRFVNDDLTGALAGLDTIFAEALLPPAGLVCVPWLTQANPLWPQEAGAGTLFGLAEHTTLADSLRAVAAGMACEFARIFAGVAASGLVDSLVLGGGASKGAHFRLLLAALFAPLPVAMLADEDYAGARGTLYAFDPALAQSTPQPLPPADPVLVDAAAAYAAHYQQLFTLLYGHLPLGAPYTVTPTPEGAL